MDRSTQTVRELTSAELDQVGGGGLVGQVGGLVENLVGQTGGLVEHLADGVGGLLGKVVGKL